MNLKERLSYQKQNFTEFGIALSVLFLMLVFRFIDVLANPVNSDKSAYTLLHGFLTTLYPIAFAFIAMRFKSRMYPVYIVYSGICLMIGILSGLNRPENMAVSNSRFFFNALVREMFDPIILFLAFGLFINYMKTKIKYLHVFEAVTLAALVSVKIIFAVSGPVMDRLFSLTSGDRILFSKDFIPNNIINIAGSIVIFIILILLEIIMAMPEPAPAPPPHTHHQYENEEEVEVELEGERDDESGDKT